ncbi:MAG: hypothetical protein ABSG86_16395 [Thermoguttaceae bacterium]
MMTTREPSDHWAELASTLGAEPPPEAPVEETRHTPAEEAAGPAGPSQEAVAEQPPGGWPAPAPPPPPRPPVRRPAPNWDALATELGVEPTAPPPPVRSVPPPPAPRAPVEKPHEPQRAGGGRNYRNVRTSSPVEEPDEPQPVAEVLTEAAEGLSEVAEELATVAEVGEEPAPARVGESAPAREEESAPERKEGGRRRRRRRRSRSGFGAPAGAEPGGPGEAEPPEAELPEVDADLPSEQPDVAEAETDAVERTGRPAGGRRRGRRERPSRPDIAREAETGGPDETPVEADLDEHEELTDEDQAEAEGGADHVGFRNIPTWPEAVGMIIAKNMESRAKNPGNPRPRGGPRGRGGRGNRRSSDNRGS